MSCKEKGQMQTQGGSNGADLRFVQPVGDGNESLVGCGEDTTYKEIDIERLVDARMQGHQWIPQGRGEMKAVDAPV